MLASFAVMLSPLIALPENRIKKRTPGKGFKVAAGEGRIHGPATVG